jgi:hypothetical protein
MGAGDAEALVKDSLFSFKSFAAAVAAPKGPYTLVE